MEMDYYVFIKWEKDYFLMLKPQISIFKFE